MYEVREAATYCHYNWPQWLALDNDERAFTVAQYRTHHLIEAHINEAINTKMERDSRRSQRKR